MPQGRWLTSLTIDGLTVGRRLALAATISEAVHERLGTLTVAAHACRSTLLKIITLFARHGDAAEMTAVLLLTLVGITPLRVSARVFAGNERRTFFTLLHLIAGSGRTLTVRLLFSLAAGLTEGSSLLLSSLSSAGDIIYITPTGLTVIAALTVETRITPARVQRLLTAGRAVTAAGGTVSVLTGPAATIARAFRDAMSDTPAAPRALFTSDTDGKPLTGFRLGQETVTLPGTAAPALLAAFGRALTRVREMLLSAPETAPFFLLGTTDVRFTQRSRFTAVARDPQKKPSPRRCPAARRVSRPPHGRRSSQHRALHELAGDETAHCAFNRRKNTRKRRHEAPHARGPQSQRRTADPSPAPTARRDRARRSGFGRRVSGETSRKTQDHDAR